MCLFNTCILMLLALTLLLGVSKGYQTLTHDGNLHQIFLDKHNLLIASVCIIFQFQNGLLSSENIVHPLNTSCIGKNCTHLLETDMLLEYFI